MLQIHVLTVLGLPTVVTRFLPDLPGPAALPPPTGQLEEPLGYWTDPVWAENSNVAALVDLLERALNACEQRVGERGGWPHLV